MAIILEQGEHKILTMNLFHVGLGLDVNESDSQYDFDLDVSAFMIGSNKKILSDDYLVFYNSEKRVKNDDLKTIVPSSLWPNNDNLRHLSRPVDPDLSVIGSFDGEDGHVSENMDIETFDINLSNVNPAVQEIIFCTSIYNNALIKGFGQFEGAYVRLYKPGHEKEGEEEYRYDLTEDFSTCASIELFSLYRYNGEWKIQALGIGHRGGVEELVSKFM